MAPSKDYYNSRTFYNINRNGTPQNAKPYYPSSKPNTTQSSQPRGGSSARTAQTGSANVAAQLKRTPPEPTKRTPFKHPTGYPPQRFSKHAEAFLLNEEEYITTYEKSACPGGECQDPNCGDNDSSGDDGEAYMAESSELEENQSDEQSFEGFTAGESENWYGTQGGSS